MCVYIYIYRLRRTNLSEAKLINFTFNEVVNFALSGHTINIQRVKYGILFRSWWMAHISSLNRFIIITGLKRSPLLRCHLSLSYLITAVTLIITFSTRQMAPSFFPVSKEETSRHKVAGHFVSDFASDVRSVYIYIYGGEGSAESIAALHARSICISRWTYN